jgi:N-acyl-D-aspartate/D-glutamate deacylase
MSNWTLAGVTIVDGTGAEPFYGNIVIEGDRIASAGTSERRGTVIDATGLVAVPGFVDIHSHLDWIAPLPNGPSLLAPNVQQGIDVRRRELRGPPHARWITNRTRLTGCCRKSGLV